MTLEDAGEDHVAHRQCRIERLGRAAAGVAQRSGTGAADLALPSRRRVQAQRQVECGGGGPERLVFGLVVAPVLGRILGDHRTGEAQAGGALQLPDPVLDVVEVDHRDALQSGGIGAAELGEPVVVRAKDRGHQRRVRHLEVKQPLARIEDFTGHPVERHVLEMLLGVVAAAEHVFKAPLGGDRLGGLEPRAGVRDQADPGEDLIRLDHDMVAAVDPLDPRRTIAERPIDAGLPQIGRFEHVRVGRENQRQHRHLLSHLIAGSTFGNRPIAVKVSAVGDHGPDYRQGWFRVRLGRA